MAWLGSWKYRIKLDIDYTNKIGASVTQFPVTIFLKSGDGDTTKVFDELGSNNLKMAITESDGTTQLYGEIEQWDSTNKVGVIHTSLSGWTISANTSIYLYYDSTQANNSTYIGVIDSTAGANVWDTNYLAVHHLVDATTSTVKDSTSNNKDGTKLSANNPLEVDAKIGKGQDFSTDYIGLGATWIPNVFTFSAWHKPDADNIRYIIYGDWDSSANYFKFRLEKQANNTFLAGCFDSAGIQQNAISTTTASAGTYYYVTAVRAGASSLKININGGAEIVENTNTYQLDLHTTSGIGALGKAGSYNGVYLDGIIDEVRVSNIARAAAWIKGEYNSLCDTLLTYGTQETLSKNPAFLFNLIS